MVMAPDLGHEPGSLQSDLTVKDAVEAMADAVRKGDIRKVLPTPPQLVAKG